MSDTRRVLFVCVENSNRSQMAEAFARILGGDAVQSYSAGSRPSGQINPRAVESMRELGYDLGAHASKSLDDLPDVAFDFVATMGCGDSCPMIQARLREDWAIPDPKHLPPEEYRQVRDLIRDKVGDMLPRLGVAADEN
jgi:protein-tyrosine-phosphatase